MTLSKPDVSARMTDGHIRFVDPQGNCDDHKDYKIFGDANSIIYFVRVSYNYETEKWYETNSDGTIILTREVPNKGLDINRLVLESQDCTAPASHIFQKLAPSHTRTAKSPKTLTAPAPIKTENIAPTRTDRWANQAVRGSLIISR